MNERVTFADFCYNLYFLCFMTSVMSGQSGLFWLDTKYVLLCVSGPFQRSEMAGWHSAGFFTHSLLVKRGADASFIQLGELSSV